MVAQLLISLSLDSVLNILRKAASWCFSWGLWVLSSALVPFVSPDVEWAGGSTQWKPVPSCVRHNQVASEGESN